jgi:hypothetical protein
LAGQNDDHKDKGKRRHNKELRQEIKAYIDKNVYPVLLEQRSKLESKITLQDRQKLEELRKQLATLQEQTKSFQKNLPKNRKEEMTDEQRTQRKEFHSQKKAIMQSSKEIAKNYQADIDQVLSPIQAQKEQWKQDIKAICEKYSTQNPDTTHKHKHGHRHKEFKKMAKEQFKEMKPAMFLLMESAGNQAITTIPTEIEKNEDSKVFPNPSATQTTIEFKVKEAGNVQIVLIDAQGNVLKSILNENKEKGTYKQSIDLSGLRQGTYFYKISMPNKTETNKIVVE